MLFRKIWITLAFVTLNAVVAQQTPKAHVKVQVTDITGACAPGAEIVIDPEAGKKQTSAKTDSFGYAALELPLGTHVLSITLLGFNEWTNKIDVPDISDQVISATLTVHEFIDVIIIPEDTRIQPESDAISSSIPLRALRRLDPLPSGKRSCCKSQHNSQSNP